MKRIFSTAFFKSKGFVLLFLLPLLTFAQWSPEILIWENEEGTPGLAAEGSMMVDSAGHVHMVYGHTYRHSSYPQLVRTGFSYTQFDDHGNKLVPDIFLSDSLDDSGGYPLIRFFGQDSLWVMWIGSGQFSTPSQKYVSLDLNGNVLNPVRDFERLHWPGGDVFAFDVCHDRTVVVADGDGLGNVLYMTVQSPGGERVMDDEVVWDSTSCWRVLGYIDHTDSLQLLWRQSGLSGWYATFTKRVDTYTPFDSSQLSEHVELTPLTSYTPMAVHPIGDSIIAVVYSYPGIPYEAHLHLYRRDTYELINQTYLGGLPGDPNFAIEGDTVLSTLAGGDNRSLYFQRYRLSDLERIEDSLFAAPSGPTAFVGLRDFVVSPEGTRHVLYLRSQIGSAQGTTQLLYRYWPYTPSAVERGVSDIAEAYSVYPNPTNNTITLSGQLNRIKTIRIFNLLGQNVNTYSFEPGMSRMPTFDLKMEGLPSGEYLVDIEEEHHFTTKKILFIR